VDEWAWPAEGAESWEGDESWEGVVAGVDAVVSHLAVARTMAQLGGIYCANAEAKLKGKDTKLICYQQHNHSYQQRNLW